MIITHDRPSALFVFDVCGIILEWRVLLFWQYSFPQYWNLSIQLVTMFYFKLYFLIFLDHNLKIIIKILFWYIFNLKGFVLDSQPSNIDQQASTKVFHTFFHMLFQIWTLTSSSLTLWLELPVKPQTLDYLNKQSSLIIEKACPHEDLDHLCLKCH